MSTKLKPCPFCGSKDIEWNSDELAYDWVIYWLKCMDCEAESLHATSRYDVLSAWDRRKFPEVKEMLVEIYKIYEGIRLDQIEEPMRDVVDSIRHLVWERTKEGFNAPLGKES